MWGGYVRKIRGERGKRANRSTLPTYKKTSSSTKEALYLLVYSDFTVRNNTHKLVCVSLRKGKPEEFLRNIRSEVCVVKRYFSPRGGFAEIARWFCLAGSDFWCKL